MVCQFRFALFLGTLLGIGLLVVAAQTPIDCPNTSACKTFRKDERGIKTTCEPSKKNDKSNRICSVIYFLSGKGIGGYTVMQMATNPSCNQCIAWNNQEGMDRCNEYMESYKSFTIQAKGVGYKFCYTSATPYICTNPDKPEEQYLTCSIQAKDDCPP